mmetsp:Transcript_70774/g.205185  ORF Transcript_70774/g.205185 Transcript_70774/m.205185 type:complete len:230 (-) Transcript_70774:442-1131(-)
MGFLLGVGLADLSIGLGLLQLLQEFLLPLLPMRFFALNALVLRALATLLLRRAPPLRQCHLEGGPSFADEGFQHCVAHGQPLLRGLLDFLDASPPILQHRIHHALGVAPEHLLDRELDRSLRLVFSPFFLGLVLRDLILVLLALVRQKVPESGFLLLELGLVLLLVGGLHRVGFPRGEHGMSETSRVAGHPLVHLHVHPLPRPICLGFVPAPCCPNREDVPLEADMIAQ